MYNSSQNPLETGWDLYQGQGDTKKLSFNWKLSEPGTPTGPFSMETMRQKGETCVAKQRPVSEK